MIIVNPVRRVVLSLPTTLSPLRYPGGKAKLYSVVKEIIELNDLHGTYIEPFAGGAGLAIKLLLNNDVRRIVINDSDVAIYSFWRCVLYHPDELCKFINTVPLTYEEWINQRNIYLNQENHNEVDIGKATLYLNRTNRSGIIKGGIIGGKNQQGAYLMDARFNRTGLVSKVRRIAAQSSRIELHNSDVFDFLKPDILGHYYKAFINFDPPYVQKGGQLYMNFFSDGDHRKLCAAISSCRRKWIVTYDICALTKDLYQRYRCAYLDLIYSANNTRKAKEYIFFSNNLEIPSSIELINKRAVPTNCANNPG